MDVLWAPWRAAYVSGHRQPAGCLFCTVLAAGDDPEHWILARTPSAFLMLNVFPYSSGHLMAVVNRHVEALQALSDEETLGLLRLVQRGIEAVEREYRPDGFNVGANLGRMAGAGVEGHLHLHIVPRWAGDTNFMPVVGAVKVIPEDLRETFRRLRPHLVS
jgi:ATP adenylyltransferase